jgi:hypothetical protein
VPPRRVDSIADETRSKEKAGGSFLLGAAKMSFLFDLVNGQHVFLVVHLAHLRLNAIA